MRRSLNSFRKMFQWTGKKKNTKIKKGITEKSSSSTNKLRNFVQINRFETYNFTKDLQK